MKTDDVAGNEELVNPTPTPLESSHSANIEVALCAGISVLRENHEGIERDYFRISSIGMCPLRQVAERAGLPITNPPSRREVFKMWMGTVLHQEAQKALTSVGYLDPVHTEAEVRYETFVGHPDGVARPIPDKPVVEFKTTDDDAITRYPDMPINYLWQGFTYCLALKRSRLLVFQLGRAQGLARSRLYPLTDEFIQRIDDHIKDMNDHWARWKAYQTLPPHYHEWKWQDRTCPYLDVAARPNPEE